MFTQDHHADFDALMRATEPFAFVRFGDGEAAIVEGNDYRSFADKWTAKGKVWLRDELRQSLEVDLDGWHVGLPPACCLSRSLSLRALATVPLERQTFATLFLHANLSRSPELLEHFRHPVIVSSRHSEPGAITVPSNGVSSPWDVDAVVDELLLVRERPILLAAGPCSNIIALRYWLRQAPEHRLPIIDMGSALDYAKGVLSRHYHHGGMDDHVCWWHEKSAENQVTAVNRSTGPAKPVGNRIRIGRAEESKNVRNMQRVRPRLRIGKR